MSIQKLVKRLDAFERRAPRPAAARLEQIAALAEEVAKRTQRPFEAAIGWAIRKLGRPLTIADVDCLLAAAHRQQP